MPALATLLMGLWRVRVPELWRDEIATWSAESRSLGHLFDLLGHVDAVSGGYYLLMHFWTDVAGFSPLALRLPSVFAMAATAAFTALVGERLMSPSAGVVAGFVFAALPTVSRFAQEARAYAFCTLAVSVATWLLLRAVDVPDHRRWWNAYGIAVFVVGVFNLVALSVLVGHWALVRARTEQRRETLSRWASATAIAIVALTPLFILGSFQAHDQIGWVARPSWAGFVQMGPKLAGGVLVTVVLAVAAVAAVARNRQPGLTLVSLAVSPIVFILFISLVAPTSYWVARYLLFTLPAWCLVVACATYRLHLSVLAVPVVAVALCGLPGQVAFRTPLAHNWANYPYPAGPYPGPPGDDYRGAAQVIAQNFMPGDGVIGAHDNYDATDIDVGYYLPPSVQPRNVFVLRSAADLGSYYPEPQLQPTIFGINFSRLWFVTIGHLGREPRRLSPADVAFLDRYYILQTTWHVARETFVQLYAHR